MRRRRLYCAKCKTRHSRVFIDTFGAFGPKDETKAICDTIKGGCGEFIPLFKDEYGKIHPVRVERD